MATTMSVQLELETTTARVHRYDEYGNPLDATAAAAEYGSLGAYQRATDGLAGYTLMGVRVYDPTTGRFLQADPVYGGNADAYVYPADPITQLDTSGSRLNYRDQQKATKKLHAISQAILHRAFQVQSHLAPEAEEHTEEVRLREIGVQHHHSREANCDKSELRPRGGRGLLLPHLLRVPNGRSRTEAERGKYSVLGFTRWFDWTDNVEWSGTVTVQNICVKNPRLSIYALFT